MFFGCRVSGEKNDLNKYNKRIYAYYTIGEKMKATGDDRFSHETDREKKSLALCKSDKKQR